MDHRVKPGDDDFNWSEEHCEERLVRRSSTSEGGSDFARASSGLRLRTETPGVLRSGFPSPALPATKSPVRRRPAPSPARDRKSTRLNSSHGSISYAGVGVIKKKMQE